MANTITIDEPRPFYSQKDEDTFFYWLRDIPGYVEVIRTDNGLEIEYTQFDQDGVRELIAVLTRYGLPLSPLRELYNKENAAWFKDKNKFWYKEIFES